MILCQTMIIPNFYFITKQRVPTEKIIYNELMLRQFLEKLTSSRVFVANEELLIKIHDHIKKYLQFVRDQSNKIIKAQVLEQQSRVNKLQQQQQLQQQYADNMNGPPKGTFNQMPANLTPTMMQVNMQQQMIKGNQESVVTGQPIGFTPQQIPSSTVPTPMAGPNPSLKAASPPKQAKKPRKKATPKSTVSGNGKTSASNTPNSTTPGSKPATENTSATNLQMKSSLSNKSQDSSASMTNEIQNILKTNNELIEKEELRLKNIDIARARRRALVPVPTTNAKSTPASASSPAKSAATATNSSITGAAAYFLATLNDTLGLESEEKAIVTNATSKSTLPKSKSSSLRDHPKVLTPSAVLATPVGLNVKTPVNKSTITDEENKVTQWKGKISANLISNAFRPVIHINTSISPKMLQSGKFFTKSTPSMSGGKNLSFLEVVKERTANKRALELIIPTTEGSNWTGNSSNIWSFGNNENNRKDVSKIYPTPPEDANEAKRRKLNNNSSVDCDIFWDFDRV